MFLSLFRKKSEKDNLEKSEIAKDALRDSTELKDTIYGKTIIQLFRLTFLTDLFLDLIRTIKDPEKPNTLEELNVVYEDGIMVTTYYE